MKEKHPGIFEQSPTPKNADTIVSFLMKTEKFQNVAVFSSENKYSIVGYSLKLVRQINVSGNQNFSKKEIHEILKLQTSVRFDRKRAIQAANNLKEYYGNQGFFNTKIEISFVKIGESFLDINININEGDPCKVVEIQIKSENEKLSKTITNKLDNFTKQNFTDSIVMEIETLAREYFRKKGYLRSKLNQVSVSYNKERTQATLVYEIFHPYKYEVVIKDILRTEKREVLTQTDIRRGINLKEFEVSTLDPAIEVEKKTRQLYLKKGYPHVDVRTETKQKGDQYSKKVELYIVEGPRVKIESLNVVGRISKPESFYVDFILNNSSNILKDRYYNRKDLELGYENLITHLKNQGFLSAKVHSARIEFDNTKSKAKIQIVMDEGPLTQIRRLKFQGINDFTEKELSEVIELSTNSPLRLDLLEESIIKIKAFYKLRGYLEMKIINENDELITYNKTRTEASIDFKIYEGPQIIVGSVKIEGNDFTKSKVIYNEIELEIGTVLTSSVIDEIIRRLTRLGFFSRVVVRTLEEGTQQATRTVIISVSERDPGLFRSGIGFTSEDDLTVRGYIGASYNNLYGTGRGISSRVELKSNVTKSQRLQGRATLGYFEPFLMFGRTRGRANISYELEERDYIEERNISVMRESNRTDFLLERELTKHLKLTWTTLSIESEKNFEIPSSTSTESNISAIGPLFELDYRNNPFLPTRGSYTRWDTEYSNPIIGSSDGIEYVRTDLKLSFYTPLSESGIVWANNISGGYLKNLSSDLSGGVPSSRSFFLHGQSKIRGYGGSKSVEHIPNQTQFNVQNIDFVTGESNYYLFKTEFRFPLPSYDAIKLALFYDLGSIEFTDSDKQCTELDKTKTSCISTNTIRHSIGFGFHINTPFGPIVFDFAKKLNPRNGEREERMHLSIGSF
ncbi:MAG: BamA/TamA family outer membrane protein [Bdellovibrionales bacterium]|nr:BamA/TamA family outer membrane protein [Bdellovibrionales bacterium]